MCGRFNFYIKQAELAAFTGLTDAPELAPWYTIAPTQPILTLRVDTAGRSLQANFADP